MRPLGEWLLGMFADRYRRRYALTVSVPVMAAGSLLITVTPGYETDRRRRADPAGRGAAAAGAVGGR